MEDSQSKQMTTIPVMASSTPADCPLMSLPLEVLLSITSKLRTTDYCNFRLTSKYFEEQLFNAFSKEFFTKRQFMIGNFSLQALIDISRSRFSSTLTQVILGLEAPSPYAVQNRSSFGDQRNRSIFAQAEYTSLVNSGHDVEMLAEAFLNLPNLETIGMRDFYSRTRFRDAPNSEWKSYGVNTYVKETGLPLERTGASSNRGPDQLLLTLLRALGKSNARPRRFEFILRHSRFQDQAFHIPSYLYQTITPVLNSLSTMFLDIAPDNAPPSSHVDANTAHTNYYLRLFLAQMPNVQHLRLNFAFHGAPVSNTNILEWFARPAGTTIPGPPSEPLKTFTAPPTVPLSHLQKLDLGQCNIKPALLLSIISKYSSSLKTLSLHKICLEQLGEDIPPSSGKQNLWTTFFRKLAKTGVDLDAINMTSLQQVWRFNHRRRNVTFKDSSPPYVRRWAGTNMQSALRDFADLCEVKWEPNDSGEESEEEMDASEESDSDEDGLGGPGFIVVDDDEEEEE